MKRLRVLMLTHPDLVPPDSLKGASEQDIERYARQTTPSIRDDGRAKVLRGDTTLEEVLRVTRED